MLILSAKMSPKPLNSQDGKVKKFNCDICGREGDGRIFKMPKKGEWGVLPEDWDEVQDKRPNAKKKFVIACSYDCQAVTAAPKI